MGSIVEMLRMRRLGTIAAVAAFVPAVAMAQPGKGDGRGKDKIAQEHTRGAEPHAPKGDHRVRPEELQERREERQERREERKEAREALRDGGAAEHGKVGDEPGREGNGGFARARHDVRAAERARLIRRGIVIPAAELRAEWRLHAQRIAELRRIREVAEGAHDSAIVAKVDALLAKENERHERWIALRGGDAGPGARVIPASAPMQDGGVK